MPLMRDRIAIASLVCATAFWPGDVAGQRSGQPATSKPNVVLIMMDDMGYGDIGSYGVTDAKTPNLDRLAREGVRLTNAYANGPMCSPTRAALISGRYQQRVGIEWALASASAADRDKTLPITGTSLPALLKTNGYATGLVGKWHVGFRPEFGPNAHGFDEFFGFLGGAVDYYTHTGGDGKEALYENTQPVEAPAYLTDEITSRAVRFIDRHAAAPFFVEVAYNAVHWPFQPPDLAATDPRRQGPPRPEETGDRRLIQMPDDTPAATRAEYVRILERADEGVGTILAALERHGIAQNTLVIFTNDNGGEWLSRNTPFTHRKGTLWEGGIRVPLILRWPGRLPAGRTSEQVAITMDLNRSILAATGSGLPAGYRPDGVDILPMLTGQSPVTDRLLFWRIARPDRQQKAVRSGRWKMLVDGGQYLLFDLRDDPGERHDVAHEHTDIIVKLKAQLAEWERDVDGKTETVPELLSQDRDYSVLPGDVFDGLGWTLPDGGRAVKAIADAAPGGAFDPKQLERTRSADVGYRAEWHVVRYPYYGLDWDITGLQLTPNTPEPGLPNVAIIHGGSANWYEFFLDPQNGPGLGQYLAQRMPVILITIPGNYAVGGWTQPAFDERVPGYVLDRQIAAEEAKVRNAVFTFKLVAEGVRRLLEQTTKGPLLVVGHSTGGELQYLLKESSLKPRLSDRSLGWGTGGPASIAKDIDEQFGERAGRVVQYGRYPRVDRLRARDAAGYVSSNYVGPLNPVAKMAGGSPLAVAQAWFAAENRRRPQFKQVLQDMEHQGFTEHRPRLEQEIRNALRGNPYGVDADAVIRDLFVTMSPPLRGYRRMAWIVGRLDDGHWDPKPEDAREWNIARRFRKENPGVPIRVLMIDSPITHYGHIERPKQLAAVLLDAVKWVRAD